MQYEGVLSEVLHIRPWEVDLLTVEQMDRACAYIDKRNREAADAAGG